MEEGFSGDSSALYRIVASALGLGVENAHKTSACFFGLLARVYSEACVPNLRNRCLTGEAWDFVYSLAYEQGYECPYSICLHGDDSVGALKGVAEGKLAHVIV